VKATVLVRPKQGILDPQGEATRGALQKLGFHVETTRVGRIFDLEVNATDASAAKAEIQQMCEKLLANPLIESFEIELVA
jgi:phosphoribosylformylglycinamidine synthase PurS subunit